MRGGLTLAQVCPFRDEAALANFAELLATVFKKLNSREVVQLATSLADLLTDQSFSQVESDVLRRASKLENPQSVLDTTVKGIKISEISNPATLWSKVLVAIFDKVFGKFLNESRYSKQGDSNKCRNDALLPPSTSY